MNPSEKYLALVKQLNFNPDPAQMQAVELLDDLSAQLISLNNTEDQNWLSRFFSRDLSTEKVKGIYFWGGVGRGKTFLMDIFYQCLSGDGKIRAHYHDFMNQIQQSLRQKSDLENPLQVIAKEMANRAKVICLDEFVITDIADAMIMAGLLEHLFNLELVIVTTSNAKPTDLYKDGLQRARFLPAITLLKTHLKIVNLDSGTDYRLLGLQQTNLYTVPHSRLAEELINRHIKEHVTPALPRQNSLCINNREIECQFCAGDTIWFSFSELCKTTRSQTDYLELARMYNTLILSDIEVMDSTQDDIAKRFVLLIDVMYDHRVKLICTAASAADKLYKGKRLSFEFARTRSRLIEMQSQQYLTQAHTQQ